MKIRSTLLAVFLGACHLMVAQEARQPVSSPLGFSSTISWLDQSFAWAKQQALAYARAGSKTMGPWYEAALPGRDAFCMRDVSHQVEGAAALGLYESNHNMLALFAGSAAQSRDWAAWWEIDGKGRPSTADYVSDDDFWFNLPANFDVLDASVRMWQWTGDDSFRSDPVFQGFFRATMTGYIQSWQLAPEAILKRPRIANQRSAEGRFVHSRGIPSYTEDAKDFIFGADLLAAEYRAMRSFAEVSNDAILVQKTQNQAEAVQSVLERVAWSEKERHYLGTIRRDLSGSGSGDTLVLYFGAAKDPAHVRGALDYVSSPQYWKQINIEEESYIPLTLFRYGRNAIAYEVLADMSSPQKPRREYPEVSYAVVEAIIGGVMGLSPGGRREAYEVATISRLPTGADQATLTGVAIKQNQLELTHTGSSASRLKNLSGPALRWRAEFTGTVDSLSVDGKRVTSNHSVTGQGFAISWTEVTVRPGAEVTVAK